MMHPHTELRFISPEVGYGVFATKPIPRGTVTWVLCQFDKIMTPAEVDNLPSAYMPLIERYSYVNGDGNYVLCWDYGRNINHGCDAAMMGVGADFEIAVRDIAVGEQITCEYGGLNITGQLKCRCGSPKCRGVIRGDDVLKYGAEWDALIAANLKFSPHVQQPLLGFARNPQQFWGWVNGIDPVPSQSEYHSGADVSDVDCSDRPWALPRRLSNA